MIKLIFSRLILSILLCLMLIGYIFLFTTPGLELSLAVLAASLPGKLHINHVSGALFSDFNLQQVRYDDNNTQTNIKSIHFAWNPSNLFHNQLTVTHLSINQANVILLKSKSKNKTSFDLNDLRWLSFIDLQNASFNSITLTQDNNVMLVISNAQISRQNSGYDISAKTSDGDIKGTFTSYPDLNWSTTLHISHWNPRKLLPTLPGDIQLTIQASGDTRNFLLQLDDIKGSIQNHSIQGNLNLGYQDNKAIINPSEIKIADSIIQTQGRLSDHWDLHWKIHIPNLSILFPNSRGSLVNTGEISGLKLSPQLSSTISLNNLVFNQQKINHLNAEVSLLFSQHKHSTLKIDARGVDAFGYHIEKMHLASDHVFKREKDALYTNSTITIDNQPLISADISFPNYANNYKLIRGKVVFHTNSLNLISDFSNLVKNTSGNFNGSFSLEGELPQLKIAGEAKLTNAQVTIPSIGITLTNINLQAKANNATSLNLTGDFTSSPGSGHIDGTCDLSNHFATTINVSGKNLRISNLEHYKITASPSLKLTYQPNGIEIQGNVLIPEAKIVPTDFSNTLIMPDEVVYVGKSNVTPTSTTNNLTLNIILLLGENINIQYDELKTQLGGKLQITQNPGTPVIATGELYAIKGTYRAYGKLLNIQQGRLLYTGNTLMNPGLNIRAMRDIKTIAINNGTSTFSNTQLAKPIYTGNETVSVGVQVQGTADSPSITLVSNPSMTQSDILSYLLFGYPQSQASGASQIGAILNATSAMNLGVKTPNVSGLTEGLQNKLGLNELSVGSTEVFDPNKGTAVATTSFIVGKELARNLYLHYSVGLFNPVSILNLRYQITKRWAIQSEASTIDSGADILYGFEKD